MYYPKSQIKPNLYTNGDEYVIQATQAPYVGYYYATSTGQYFTGRTPDDRPNQELIKIVSSQQIGLTQNSLDSSRNISTPVFNSPRLQAVDTIVDNNNSNSPIDYAQLKSLNTFTESITLVPYYIASVPTEQDYQIGEFRRYFCKKTNEILYLEINKATYDKLIVKDIQYLYSLYEPFNLPWKLTGTKEEVEKINRNIVELTSKRLQLPQFGRYLKDDYLKYYK
jgi:hypothetical protein